ncbi:sensor histidine kinase [Halarcobacter anaerophilus]|uniref:histidine kinase n=1 Tax=Halarcobacter anaerophilus TaxID=877500 RepID=A0A4Q0XX07_9BACT|nr:sensor histidine kinase [Halarcobacter anaerophilus]QDF28288.1 signal transduction sensor histidine kinase [Halarcobacter anaerophilus]RXJ62042.1 hypothetical protein CRV06_11465 [Halarcobacter anaerophilus]
MPKKALKNVISSHFIKFSLIPIFVVEVALLILYFSINEYISSKSTNLLLKEAQAHTYEVLQDESKFISDKLNDVSTLAKFLQNEHQTLFKNPSNFALPNGKPSFSVAKNGVFYKTNHAGASLYYSSHTKIDKKAREKAIFTEAMDTSLKNIVDINSNIVAAYFNSWDNMNRLYPFIDYVYDQYGSHIQMKDYNFYYLADLKHNPKKEPVWTSTYLDPAGNGWMLSCIVPIYKGDFLEGVTGLDITIDSIVNNLLSRKLPYNANLFMVDDKGMILAMPEKIENLLGLKELKEHLYTNAILKTIEKPEEFNILKNNSPFASHFKKLFEKDISDSILKIGENEYLTFQQTINETNWKLMILIDKKEIFGAISSLKDMSNKIGYLAIAFLLLFYIIFFYLLIKKIYQFSQGITEPIEKLSTQTSQIKSTDSKIDLIKTDISEISLLNSNFRTMMNELNEKTQKLFEAKNVAERLSQAKDDFMANMSHELKTPLNSINVISSIMKRNSSGNLNEKQLKSLEIINRCGNDLLFLINDVLDLSKLEAGQIILDNRTFSVKNLMEGIHEIFHFQAEDKNLELVYEIDESLDLIYSDEERIKQIIKNLLSNALKFTHEGKIFFRVKDEKEKIRVTVEDQGIGIAEDKLEYIFDRFKQADSSTTRRYGGSGLGLAICKDLLSLLHGDISVSSKLGKGSKFEVTFPKNENKIELSEES